MKNARCVVWWFCIVGLVGLASMEFGLHRPVYPNGWVYVGLMLWVAALIALLCLFVVRCLEFVCGLHPVVDFPSR